MTKNLIFAALLAVSVATPTFVFADPESDRSRDEHSGERGAGPNHSYHKGDRLPPAEQRQQYVVNDWQTRNMREPPHGYHWVRSGDDYVLAAITTGVIADIVLNH